MKGKEVQEGRTFSRKRVYHLGRRAGNSEGLPGWHEVGYAGRKLKGSKPN